MLTMSVEVLSNKMTDTQMTMKAQNSGGGVLLVSPEQKQERNYGIDLLRIYAMFLIVLLHIVTQGGVLKSAVGVNRIVALFLEAATICCVDIFALISGFVGYRESTYSLKSSRILTLWFQVFFYSFGIVFLVYLFGNSTLNIKGLLMCVFPISTNKYWYFTSYFPVLLLSPWVNSFVRTHTQQTLVKLAVLLLLIFSVYPSVCWLIVSQDIFNLSSGYSFLWLLILYIIGAVMRKYNLSEQIKTHTALITIAATVVLTVVLRSCLPEKFGTDVFIRYTSPTIVLMAIAYVVLFSKLKFGSVLTKIIVFLSPAAFGVYLIHVHPYIFEHYFINAFVQIAEKSVGWMTLIIFVYALLIMTACLAIEKVRLFLFRILHIDDVIQRIGKMIDRKWCRFSSIFDDQSILRKYWKI